MKYIPKLTEGEIKENHDRLEERASVYKERGLDLMESRRRIIEKARPLKGNTLEIGAGNGHMTFALARAGYRLTAIDKDREALKVAALNLAYENLLSGVELYVMDGNSLAFERGSFDNVVMVNMFHHISDIGGLLSEADRVLRAKGRLVLADFNERGMEIVDSVHRRERRVHENSGVGKQDAYACLRGLGYAVKEHEDPFHWILIAEKKRQ